MSTTHEPGFVDRHLGPDQSEIDAMLAAIGRATLDELIGATVPVAIAVTVTEGCAEAGLSRAAGAMRAAPRTSIRRLIRAN